MAKLSSDKRFGFCGVDLKPMKGVVKEVAVAFVIPAPGDHDRDAVAFEIMATCAENLASFKVPRAVYFVDAFPTGTLEKILKNKLREVADAQPPVD